MCSTLSLNKYEGYGFWLHVLDKGKVHLWDFLIGALNLQTSRSGRYLVMVSFENVSDIHISKQIYNFTN
jgi:hypothetical protein